MIAIRLSDLTESFLHLAKMKRGPVPHPACWVLLILAT